jgi:MoxR-like ATPase
MIKSLRPKPKKVSLKAASNVSASIPEAPKKVAFDNELFEKLQLARSTINHSVFERENETDGLLISILSGTNMLFFGDVGAAKTMQIQIASVLFGLSYFDILLSDATKPTDIFGPTDIPALAEGKQQTKYIGYAPDAEILFLDEIFKANASILNQLLWLLNEHKFRDGDNGIVKCKVKTAFAASNELPSDPILKAIYDRLLLRYQITYIKDETNMKELIGRFLSTKSEFKPIFTDDDLQKLQALTRNVSIPDDVRDTAIRIRRSCEYATGSKISDRRFLSSFRAVQASAILGGRVVADLSDLEVFAHIFWDNPNAILKVQSVVFSNTSNDTAALSSYWERAVQIKDTYRSEGKLRDNLKELKSLHQHVSAFKGRYARQVASEIKAVGLSVAELIRQRKTFTVIRVFIGESPIVKAAPASVLLWSGKELRSFGFRHRRKANYWYTTSSKRTLKATMDKHGIDLIVSSMKLKS